MIATAQITLFTKLATLNDPNGALLSKRIALGFDGKPVSDGSSCRMANGTASTVPAADAGALARLIETMQPCNALALGSIVAGNGAVMNVVTAPALAKLPPTQLGNNTIARTREYFVFHPATPAWLLVDCDLKGMPAHVAGRIEAAGGVWQALLSIAPGLAQTERVTRASTSAGLWRDTGERFPASGGSHTYVLTEDGTDIDRAVRALHERCWLHGLGWLRIGAAGQLLERSIVDASVRFPERLVFEGPPDIVPPLAQDAAARRPQVTEGEAITTRTIIPDLTRDEAAQVEAAKLTARRTLEPEASAIRAAADGRLVEEIVTRIGVPRAVALRQVQARHRGILTADIQLLTDHQGLVSVREILADPERFVDETMPDPLEGPSYGFGKARILRSHREPGRIYINTFAHGGATFDLKHDFASAKALLEAAPVAALGDVLCVMLDASDLEADEVRQLVELCATRAPKVGLRAFQRRVRDDQERRRKERRKAAAERQAGVDRREYRIAPPRDGELGPVIRDIDRVLGADNGDLPPMRRADGTLVELRVVEPFNLHQLASDGSNGEADPAKGGFLPAPPEPLLVEKTPITTRLMIEKFFIFQRVDEDGTPLYRATLSAAFVDAFMQLAGSDSKLSRVHAVNTAPLVAESGALIDGIGLDRSSGLLHHIEPAVRDCLPRDEITAEIVRDAVTWLCDEWLVDVLTNRTGKLLAITIALTLIERNLLSTLPAFLLTAGLRGGGKTTLIHMIVLAVFGRYASAASWSENQEERRKALFGHFRQGVALLVWDNIKNGAEIACPEVEKALTSPTIQDRILGISAGAVVPTTTIQVFVGNNVKFAGDMASRGPELRLTSDDPRPEDRVVKHEDPLAWTQEHRAKILRCLYVILIYGCRCRPDEQVAKTRFKGWWKLCGWPVEHAASLLDPPVAFDFVERFKATEEHDSKAAGVAASLNLLKDEFGSIIRGAQPKPTDWFRAKQIREILDDGERARARFRTEPKAAQVQIDRANSFLEMVAELTGKRNLNPITSIIGAALSAIVDRPVGLDTTTIGILRARISRGAKEFLVETHPTDPHPEISCFDAASVLETGDLPHQPHHRENGSTQEEGLPGGGGGGKGPFSNRSNGQNTEFPEAPQPSHPAVLQPEAEEARETGGLILDIETFSTVDLKKVGLHFYAAHKTTGVSVACYAFGATGAVQVWQPGEPVPEAIRRHITEGGRMVAHNAAFEAALLREVLGPRYGWPIPEPAQWSCTLARAVYHGFPPSLEALSEAVPLKNKKDSAGHGLMLRMARPRGFRADGSPRWWHEEDKARLDLLTDYCMRDALAEQELDQRLPELPPRERELWLMDAAINHRGILIDTVGTEVLAKATAAETSRLDQELSELTGGAVPAASNITALKLWLAGRSLSFVSLDKDHIVNALASPAVLADAAACRALQIRQEGSLASTAKLKPMLGTLGADGRARGLFAYYGAIRTGRWAGRRIQPQNLVRGLADAGDIIDTMVSGADLRALAAAQNTNPLELVSGCLRGLFVAPPGRRLVAVDLSQIEARTLAWLAGEEDLLRVFRDPDQDIYVYTAERLGSGNRQLGKVVILGLGYQMGAERFVDAAKKYGVILTEAEAAQIVAQWRQDHPAIARLWLAMQETVEAIAQGSVGDAAEVGRCLVYRRPGSVRIRLPSGRELIYHEMALVESACAFRSELAFMGPHPLSRKWTQQRTYGGKLVENITQAVARDVLAEGMLELHMSGHHILGSVHDEVLLEADEVRAEALLEETLILIRTPPSWAEGLPIEAEGFVSPRYRKA